MFEPGAYLNDSWHMNCGYKQKENEMTEKTFKENLQTVADWLGETYSEFDNAHFIDNVKPLANKIRTLSTAEPAPFPGDEKEPTGAELKGKDRGGSHHSSMTIREQIATRALSGLLADPTTAHWEHKKFATAAVSHADALLAELSK